MKVPVDSIQINSGRRETDRRHIGELAASMAELGLLNPITIDQGHTLIASLHRLEAAKLLGWTEIDCTVTSLEGLQAELAEIDENIIRHNLDYLEEGEQLARRKEIYETLHPETRQGKRNGQTSKTAISAVLGTKPFTADTAEKIGMAERTIRQKIQVATKLTPETKEVAREHKIGFKNAVQLSRLEPEQQKEAADLLAAREIQSVHEYTVAKAEQPEPEPPEDEGAEEWEEPEASAVPFTLESRPFASFQESVADLKDPNKDCSCTPDTFLAEITAFVRKFQREIEWYSTPYYEAVFPALTGIQLDYLRQQTGIICSAAETLCSQVERKAKT